MMAVRSQMPRLGTRKLYYILQEELDRCNLKIGRDKLFELLRNEGLLVVRQKKYTRTTNSKHWMRKYPNLVRGLVLRRPEQLWVADITYIAVKNGQGYLHLLTDAYSRQIMGYELSADMAASSTMKALRKAIRRRRYTGKLIHHSDRGLQYCSHLYTSLLKKNDITISMTEAGDPYENAVAERVNGILKEEFGMGECFDSLGEAALQLKQAIFTYNSQRPHLSCYMFTPEQMHRQNKIKPKSWKKRRLKSINS